MWIWKPLIVLAIGAVLFVLMQPQQFQKPTEESYPNSWHIPRTLKTTNGKVFHNATIRSLAKDGVIINHGAHTLKIPSGMMDAGAMAIIVKTAPASGVSNSRESPFVINADTLRPPVHYRRPATSDQRGRYEAASQPVGSH